MGNIDNKEKEFAETLKLVTRTARENRNVISEEEVKEAFSELDLSEEQLGMVTTQPGSIPSRLERY